MSTWCREGGSTSGDSASASGSSSLSRGPFLEVLWYNHARHVRSFPATIAEGSHPFPFRTRKLSPPAPMVLRWQRRGRVGHRRDKYQEARGHAAGFLLYPGPC